MFLTHLLNVESASIGTFCFIIAFVEINIFLIIGTLNAFETRLFCVALREDDTGLNYKFPIHIHNVLFHTSSAHCDAENHLF